MANKSTSTAKSHISRSLFTLSRLH